MKKPCLQCGMSFEVTAPKQVTCDATCEYMLFLKSKQIEHEIDNVE
jgi:hypothetical protein